VVPAYDDSAFEFLSGQDLTHRVIAEVDEDEQRRLEADEGEKAE
jgi:hypothetical protein